MMMDSRGKKEQEKIVAGLEKEAGTINKSENILHRMADSLKVLIAYVDRDQRYRFNNKAYEDWFGLSRDKLQGRTVREVTGEKYYESVHRHVETALSGEEVSFEGELNNKDGNAGHFHVRLTPHRNDTGDVEGYFVLASDISERKKAEEELKKTQKMIQAFMYHSPSVMFLKDTEGRYLIFNRAGEGVIGAEPGSCIGKTDHDLFSKEIADAYRKTDLRAIEAGKPLEYEEVAPHPDGMQHYYSVKFPLLDEKGVPYALCGIATNINKLKQAEAKLEEKLRFEKLITGLSAKFINIVVTQIDDAIEDGLKIISGALGFQRSNFFQFAESGKGFNVTHSYEAPGVKKAQPRTDMEVEFPWLSKTLQKGEIVCFSRVDELPSEAGIEKEYILREGVRSVLIIPLELEGKRIGAISFATMEREQEWSDDLIDQLRLVCEIFTNALARKRSEGKLKTAFFEIKQLKDQLEAENILLREEIKQHHGHEEIVGNSEVMKEVLYRVRQVAPSDSTVLLLGETGTGKELLAHEIHRLSPRKDRPMVTVNCAALPATLIEAELFGREKGAFTGALTKQVGRFEISDGGTIFLDEIGDLPTELQTKLLRVIHEGQFERLGSTKTLTVNVRVIAATNREIDKLVEEGRFREDLFYRLNVFPITAPPLRDRSGDIPILTWFFARELGERMGKTIERINRKDLEALARYHWPGNVRELRNVIERAMILCKSTTLNIPVPKAKGMKPAGETQVKTIREVERQHILSALERTSGKVSGKGGAAEILGLKPTTLRSRMEKLGIKNRK